MILSGVVAEEKITGGGGGGHRPLASEFTFVNFAYSPIDDVDALKFPVGAASGVEWRLIVQPPLFSPPYNVKMQFYWNTGDVDSTVCGIYFVDGSNKMAGFEQIVTHSAGRWLAVRHATNPTTDAGNPWSGPNPGPWGALDGLGGFNQVPTAPVWIRLRNDGTTLFYDYSSDGTTWVNAYSEPVGSFITPVNIGIGGLTIGVIPQMVIHVISLDYGANATF